MRLDPESFKRLGRQEMGGGRGSGGEGRKGEGSVGEVEVEVKLSGDEDASHKRTKSRFGDVWRIEICGFEI